MIDPNKEIEFTERARSHIRRTMSTPEFEEDGAEGIFKTLEKEIAAVSFGDYLKRYIHRKAEMEIPFDQVESVQYQQIIVESFKDNRTPQSFEPTTAKLSALARNWLSQRFVKRSVVFLLGFGLSMTVEDVNEFLEKGLRDRGIYPKDPFEAICWYCYKNGYGFARFETLWQQYQDLKPDAEAIQSAFAERTINMRNLLYAVDSDESLLAYLSWLKAQTRNIQSVTAREWFDRLYAECRKLVASYLNESEIVEEIRTSGKRESSYYSPDEITAGDIEKVIYSAVPVDVHGNLIPEKKSLLNEQFGGKRFSRQRISEILNGKTEINRFDLITLYFFVLAKKMEDDFGDIRERARYFMKSINRILEECQMWPLYVANPYESFIFLCMQTEDPLETYAQVWELAYDE